MKRVRRKETNGNNNLQCITRSKKQRGSHENDSDSIIPTDLIIEILTKLPPKSIVKFIIVSKLWYSIIRSKYFTELFISRSLTQPRFLLPINKCLHSSSSSGHHHSLSITPYPAEFYRYYRPIRGLICCQNNTKVVIGNPSTGQFATLPRVKTRRRCISTFFGYDPVTDRYKLLSMTHPDKCGSRTVSEEHQVFTVGAKRKTWRMIKCKHPHLPSPIKGLCINGVVYYFALINNHERSLVSFNLSSEDFNLIKLPQDVRLLNLVNYGGKIALTRPSCNGTLDLCVLEDASKQEWSKVSVLVPSWKDLVNRTFKFTGVLSTGELIFSPESAPHPFYIISYDPKENNTKKVVIEGLGDDFGYAEVFLDHVESPLFLPKIS